MTDPGEIVVESIFGGVVVVRESEVDVSEGDVVDCCTVVGGADVVWMTVLEGPTETILLGVKENCENVVDMLGGVTIAFVSKSWFIVLLTKENPYWYYCRTWCSTASS